MNQDTKAATCNALLRFAWASALVLAPYLTDSKSHAVDLNKYLDDQATRQRDKILACLREGELVNFSDDVSVRSGVVYKGISCFGLYGGYSGWTILGKLDEVVTTPCEGGGNVQEQWTVRSITDPPRRNPRHLVLIRKKNDCWNPFLRTHENHASIEAKHYQVRWTCTKSSGYDPEKIGRDCSAYELE